LWIGKKAILLVKISSDLEKTSISLAFGVGFSLPEGKLKGRNLRLLKLNFGNSHLNSTKLVVLRVFSQI